MTYATQQAAIDSLTNDGFTFRGDGFYGKKGMTQGSLVSEPYERLALATVKHNRVDPQWNSPDYFTIDWH